MSDSVEKEFRLRFLVPVETHWFVEKGEFLSEVIQDFHVKQGKGIPIHLEPDDSPDGMRCTAHLASIEVEGEGVFTGKYYSTGIYRKGAVRYPGPTLHAELKAAAEKLGWKLDPRKLIEEWPGAETWDEVRGR